MSWRRQGRGHRVVTELVQALGAIALVWGVMVAVLVLPDWLDRILTTRSLRRHIVGVQESRLSADGKQEASAD